MKSVALIAQLAAVLLAALALWSIRHAINERATTRLAWVAALLLVLTLARFVTSQLMARESGRCGVLGAAAAFLAA